MDGKTKRFVAAVIAAGLGVGALLILSVEWSAQKWLPVIVFGPMVVATGLWQVILQDPRLSSSSSYINITSAILFASFFLIEPGILALIIAMMSLCHGIYYRIKWYRELFNWSQYMVALGAASWIWSDRGLNGLLAGWNLLWASLALSAFIVVNYVLVFGAVSLSSNQPFLKLINLVSAINEVVSLFSGLTMAILWNISPALIFFVVLPLVALFVALVRVQRQGVTVENQREELATLHRLGLEIGAELELSRLLKRICRIVTQALHANGTMLWRMEGKTVQEWEKHPPDSSLLPWTWVGSSLWQVLREKGSAVILCGLPDSLAEPSESLIFYPLARKDGGGWYLLAKAGADREPLGAVDTERLSSLANYVSIALQNAELYQDLQNTQEKLLQAEKMSAVGCLVAGVAHEINNPLTSVMGFAELLTRDAASLPDRPRSHLQELYREAERIQRLVQNMLSFARQRKPEKSVVQINQLLEETLELRSYDFRVNNMQVRRHLDPDLPETVADAHQLKQVFLNIINNAYDAMYEAHRRGTLVVRTGLRGDHVFADFRDDGPGIVDLRRIFDPFYTTKPPGKGTGLGLSICYGIVKEHQGEILAENLKEGGAHFTVLLPVVELSLRQPEEPFPEQLPAVSPARILVVDDEEAILTLQQDILQQEGQMVEVCRTGEESIRCLRREDYDLVVADIIMPGSVSGIELYYWMRQHRPGRERRILFLTGNTVSPEVSSFLEKVPYALYKPFRVEDYLNTIRKILREECQHVAQPSVQNPGGR